VGTARAYSTEVGQDATYPGADVLGGRAAEACEPVREAYVVDPLSVPADVHLRWFLPTADEWTTDPTFTCYLAADQTTLQRSVYLGVDRLGVYQIDFLVPLQHYTHAMDRLDALPANASFADLRGALVEVAGTNADLALKLHTTTWPDQDPMAAVQAELERVGDLWGHASVASDAAGARDAMAQAKQASTDAAMTSAMTAARRALGLPTSAASR
jgi:hypothetical protein